MSLPKTQVIQHLPLTSTQSRHNLSQETAGDSGKRGDQSSAPGASHDKTNQAPFHYFRKTMIVAPNPPASGGASAQDSTNDVRARIFRTVSRCTPIPLP